MVDSENYVKFLTSNQDYETLTSIGLYQNYISQTDNINFIAVRRIGLKDSEACNNIQVSNLYNTISTSNNIRTISLVGNAITFFLCLIILILAALFYATKDKIIHGHNMATFPHTKFLYGMFFFTAILVFALSV